MYMFNNPWLLPAFLVRVSFNLVIFIIPAFWIMQDIYFSISVIIPS